MIRISGIGDDLRHQGVQYTCMYSISPDAINFRRPIEPPAEPVLLFRVGVAGKVKQQL